MAAPRLEPADLVLLFETAVGELKPYQLEQIQMELDRRYYEKGSGEPPSQQPTIAEIIT